MTRNETKELGCDEKLFKQVVKTTFNQRRKSIAQFYQTYFRQRLSTHGGHFI